MPNNNKYHLCPITWEVLNKTLDDGVDELVVKFEYEQWQLDILINYLKRLNFDMFEGAEDLKRLYNLALETKQRLTL